MATVTTSSVSPPACDVWAVLTGTERYRERRTEPASRSKAAGTGDLFAEDFPAIGGGVGLPLAPCG